MARKGQAGQNAAPVRRIRLSKHTLILGAILLAGLGLRAAYLTTIAKDPEVNTPIQDAAFHDYWARALVTGDWTPPADRENPRISEVPFLRPPGYPYFMALIYRIFGMNYGAIRIAQMLLGLLSCFLTYLLGKALFNRTVGLVAAAFYAGYWVLIYFEAELQDPILITALTLVFMLLMQRWWERPSVRRALWAGLVLGLAALTRPNALLFVPVAVTWLVWAGWKRVPTTRLYTQAAIFLAAVLLAVAPATIRNAVVAHDFVPVSSNGAINLYIGNNETSDGTTATIPNLQALIGMDRWNWFLYDRIARGVSHEVGRPLEYSEVSAYFNHKALDYIKTHPGGFLRLCWVRAALFWGPAEVANNKAPDLEKAQNPVLRWSPGFPLVLGLALLGTAMLVEERVRRRNTGRARAPQGRANADPHAGANAGANAGRNAGPHAGPNAGVNAVLVLIVAFVATYFLSFLPFLAAGRFRVPLLPFLFLFAAYGLYRIVELARSRATGRLFAWVGAGAALTAFCYIPLAPYKSDPAWWHTDRAMALTLAGKPEGALRECEAALQANPGYVDAHVQRASLLAQMGKADQAITEYQGVLRDRPDRVDVRVRLASLRIDRGEGAAVLPDLQQITATNPNMPEAFFQLGCAFTRLGRYAEAEPALRRSLELRPSQPTAHTYLGIVLAKRGAHAEAVSEFQQALKLKPGVKEAYLNLGTSLAALGRNQEAAAAYREAIRIDPHYQAAIRELAKVPA